MFCIECAHCIHKEILKMCVPTSRVGMVYALYIIGAVLLAGSLANIHSWARAFGSLFFSQGRHLKRTLRMNEGAPLTALGAEVSVMTDMVKVRLGAHYRLLI